MAFRFIVDYTDLEGLSNMEIILFESVHLKSFFKMELATTGYARVSTVE